MKMSLLKYDTWTLIQLFKIQGEIMTISETDVRITEWLSPVVHQLAKETMRLDRKIALTYKNSQEHLDLLEEKKAFIALHKQPYLEVVDQLNNLQTKIEYEKMNLRSLKSLRQYSNTPKADKLLSDKSVMNIKGLKATQIQVVEEYKNMYRDHVNG
jgi:hypothetical protein